MDVAQIQRNTGAQLIGNFEVISWFEKNGIQNCIPMNHGGTIALDFGSVKVVNAIHSSSLPDGSYGGNPVGFVVQSEGKTFYYSGDTSLTYDMKLIGEEFTVDFAFLCIGDHLTMGITDAIKAARLVGTEKIIGMHYDTFPPIKIDHELARHKAQQADKKLILMNIGETIEL
jgi:L-ascorbate metabolism protein UlaG (beta-lactamase superfamily)